MGQDQLIKAIEEETRIETERLLKEAELDVEYIVRKADEGAEAGRRQRVEGLKKEIERERVGAASRARARARSLVLSDRSAIIEGILDEVREKFEALPREERAGLVKRLFEELKGKWAAEIGSRGNRPRVLISPDDIGLIDDRDVEFVPDEAVSLGVVFVSADGRVRADNTFATRLALARKELLPRLDRLLFKQDEEVKNS